MSVASLRARLTGLKAEEARIRKDQSRYEAAAARSRKRSAINGGAEAADFGRRAADAAARLATNFRRQQQTAAELGRAEEKLLSARDKADRRRRELEKRHAREIATISKPVVRYVHEIRHVPAPEPEMLRVLYLTANPTVLEEMEDTDTYRVTRIRVDKEVRDVRVEIASALHRDRIDIDHWPAATPTDLLNGLNERRPHVVHFSGHGGDGEIQFDDGTLADPQSVPVSYDALARALGATTTPPLVVVLNACDTLDGAEVLLATVPVVIATTGEISGLASHLFATCFYRAVASGQSVRAAIDQAVFAIDTLAGGKGEVIASLTREGVDLETLILVELTENEDTP
ncbi:CHAT domain-containing protein [Streptomyces sp. NPDC006645]|uniref:CHAT domain-containing protein n=1 Tax=unclassified Streptomyces TaxID=2593676 RepID=UPI00339EE332